MTRSRSRIPVPRRLGSKNNRCHDSVMQDKSTTYSTYDRIQSGAPTNIGKTTSVEKSVHATHHFHVQLPRRRFHQIQNAVVRHKEQIELPDNVVGIDDHTSPDENSKTIYTKDVIKHNLEREKKFALQLDCLRRNPKLKASMRAIAVDWLITVQDHLETDSETINLAVAILDQLLFRRFVPLNKLQLMTITSFWISCKFIERYAPKIDTLLCLCENAYLRDEMVTAEKLIISTLGFDLLVPTPDLFLKRCAQASIDLQDEDLKMVYRMASYLLELGLTSDIFSSQPASQRTAAAWLLSRTLLDQPVWTPTLAWFCDFGGDKSECLKELGRLCLGAKTSNIQGARNKYRALYCGISEHPSLDKRKFLSLVATGNFKL